MSPFLTGFCYGLAAGTILAAIVALGLILTFWKRDKKEAAPPQSKQEEEEPEPYVPETVVSPAHYDTVKVEQVEAPKTMRSLIERIVKTETSR